MQADSAAPVRYYSEREHPLGPPVDGYGVGPQGEPILRLRDPRVWMSVEWAEARAILVPEDWRELR